MESPLFMAELLAMLLLPWSSSLSSPTIAVNGTSSSWELTDAASSRWGSPNGAEDETCSCCWVVGVQWTLGESVLSASFVLVSRLLPP